MEVLNNKSKIRVLLVDNHTIARLGFRLVLTNLLGIAAIDESDGCISALKQIEIQPPDLIIMDTHLPDVDGIEGTRQILAKHPKIKIIILSGDSSPALILSALEAGASGYLIKENSLDEVSRAIEAVMGGKAYLSPEVAAEIAKYSREKGPLLEPSMPPLADYEKQLLQLIVQGKLNKEMAVQLKVSIKSIEVYRSRLKNKLGCTSSADLIRFAIREGIAKS